MRHIIILALFIDSIYYCLKEAVVVAKTFDHSFTWHAFYTFLFITVLLFLSMRNVTDWIINDPEITQPGEDE